MIAEAFVEVATGELEAAGLGDGKLDLASKGGASCQLLLADVGLGVCARQTEPTATTSPTQETIFVFIARNLR